MYPADSLFAIAILLTLVAVPVLVRDANGRVISVFFLIAWIVAANTIYLVNAFLFDDLAPFERQPRRLYGYCVTISRLLDAIPAGLMMANACVARQLYYCVSQRVVVDTRVHRRLVCVDALLAFVIPLTLSAVALLDGERIYKVEKERGCIAAPQYSWPYLVLLAIWPSVIGLVGAYYEAKTLIHIVRSHRDVRHVWVERVRLRSLTFLRVLFHNITYLAVIFPATVAILVVQIHHIRWGSWHLGPAQPNFNIPEISRNDSHRLDSFIAVRYLALFFAFKVFIVWGTTWETLSFYKIDCLVPCLAPQRCRKYDSDDLAMVNETIVGSEAERKSDATAVEFQTEGKSDAAAV